ncbi:MAG: hypothetical protein M1836_004776 [Candelina mexicana]|nr:MAG: hypothetical protein M1836_004776 [Candelina mexicana]
MRDPITAPPRAALAKNKAGEDKEVPLQRFVMEDDDDFEGDEEFVDASADATDPSRKADKEQKESHLHRTPRESSLANRRKPKGRENMPENKARGFSAMGKLGSRVKSEPVSKPGAASSGPNGRPDAGHNTGTVDTDRSLRAAIEQRERIEEELERYKLREQAHEEEIRKYERDLTARQEQLREQSHVFENYKENMEALRSSYDDAITDLQAKLSTEAQDKHFWSRKHEEVHREYLRTESDYRALQATMIDRDGQWKIEWERKQTHLLLERDRCRESAHAAQKATRDREDEILELRRQVLDLKHNISTSTRTEGQITDDAFRDKIQRLGHDLQNWIINNFRKAKIDYSSLPEPTCQDVAAAVPQYSSMTAASKLSVVQAVVIKVLVDEVFNAYFFGMPDFQVAALKTMEGQLNALASPARVNHWRAATLAIFRQSQNDTLKNQIAELWEWVHSRIDEVLTALTGVECSDAWDKGLRSILDQAVEISHLFRIQRAEFQVLRPPLQIEQPVEFDPELMEDISGEDEMLLRGKEVGCVTFPAVFKIGDETGDNGHTLLGDREGCYIFMNSEK